MTVALTEAEALQIAHLARLSFDEAQLKRTIPDLNAILDLAATLTAINTDDITPMAHPLKMTQRLRADVVDETNQAAAFQTIAPKTEQGYYLVPTVLE